MLAFYVLLWYSVLVAGVRPSIDNHRCRMSLLQKIAKLKGVELGTTSKLVPLIQLLRTCYPNLSEQNLNNLTIDCHRNPAILNHLGIKTTHSFPYEVFECRCFKDGEICASHDFVDCNLYVEDQP